MFDVLLALNGVARRFITFEVHEFVDAVVFGVTGNRAALVFIYAPHEIVRDADINRPARAAREDIDEELPHPPSFKNRGGRDKPGHDGIFCVITRPPQSGVTR